MGIEIIQPKGEILRISPLNERIVGKNKDKTIYSIGIFLKEGENEAKWYNIGEFQKAKTLEILGDTQVGDFVMLETEGEYNNIKAIIKMEGKEVKKPYSQEQFDKVKSSLPKDITHHAPEKPSNSVWEEKRVWEEKKDKHIARESSIKSAAELLSAFTSQKTDVAYTIDGLEKELFKLAEKIESWIYR